MQWGPLGSHRDPNGRFVTIVELHGQISENSMAFKVIVLCLILALAAAGFATVICQQTCRRLHPPWWVAMEG